MNIQKFRALSNIAAGSKMDLQSAVQIPVFFSIIVLENLQSGGTNLQGTKRGGAVFQQIDISIILKTVMPEMRGVFVSQPQGFSCLV